MPGILLENIRVVSRDGPPRSKSLAVADGVVLGEENLTATAGFDRAVDLQGSWLLPGFVDVHNHGAAGVDVNSASVEDLLKVSAFLASNGVTAWMPTLVPDSVENYKRAISAIDELMAVHDDKPIAQAAGVHYEGVFASEHMCGALRPQYFRKYTGRELDDLPVLKKGVHMMTLAPEIEGGIDLITELSKRSWITAIGHTRADAATLDLASQAGARHLTHFFNAMGGIHHRDLGAAGWGLTNDSVTFDIIADGVHVRPEILKFACRAKTPGKVSLISDSVAPTGLGNGQFELWDETVTVENGRTQNERGSIAGSVITLSDAVKRMISLEFTCEEVSEMSAFNPAKLLGLENSLGSIETGRRADIVAIDDLGNLKMVMVGGRIVE